MIHHVLQQDVQLAQFVDSVSATCLLAEDETEDGLVLRVHERVYRRGRRARQLPWTDCNEQARVKVHISQYIQFPQVFTWNQGFALSFHKFAVISQ